MITSKKLLKVIATFNKLHEKNENRVIVMGSESFEIPLARDPNLGGLPECSTPACFGGEYLCAKQIAEGREKSGTYIWTEGAHELAKDCGFDHYGDMAEWAHDNPKIWGNPYGDKMFQFAIAFDHADFANNPMELSYVIDHLVGVAARLAHKERASV